jgi:hypothetical protein
MLENGWARLTTINLFQAQKRKVSDFFKKKLSSFVEVEIEKGNDPV